MPSLRRNEPEQQPIPGQPLISTRGLLIVMIGVAAGIAVAVKPDLAVPIGVGVAVVTLLIVIVGP